MKTNQIIHGDCIEEMKKLPDESIDLICTDPPYALGPSDNWRSGMTKKAEKGFMGKTWDILPKQEIWKECLRVLKPGAFAFILMTPRQDSWYRCVRDLEESGFVISFTPMFWTYACLSSDTEVLTKDGWIEWEQLHKTKRYINKEILIYNNETNTYSFEKPKKWNSYSIGDTCYRIKSDFTDQIVTRNHRVAIEQKGKLLFIPSERLQTKERICVVENLSDLQETNIQRKRIQNKNSNMFKEMPKKVNIKKQYWKKISDSNKIKINLSMLWKRIFEKTKIYKNKKLWKVLFNKLQTKSKHKKILTSLQQETQDGWTMLDREKKKETERIYDGRKKLGLERRSNLFQNTWKLYWSKIYQMSKRISGYGKKGWLCNGTSNFSGPTDRKIIKKNRSSSSQRPQSRKQQIEQLSSLFKQQRPQVARTRKGYKTTLATVTKEYYEGIVFCPTVSSGCFVARRKGKIFLTGNSGFPKASNISKLIDKRLGAEREVVEIKERKGNAINTQGKGGERNRRPWMEKQIKKYGHLVDIKTKPATPQAKQLDGSYGGFQPKPAVEIIIVAMKPLSEKTYVDQALKNFKGITWLDDCRIPYGKEYNKEKILGKYRGNNEGNNSVVNNFGVKEIKCGNEKATLNGRFPANLLVSDDVLNDGTQTKSHVNTEKGLKQNKGGIIFAGGLLNEDNMYQDSGSFSRYFDLDMWFKERIKKLPENIRKTFPFMIVPKPSKGEKNEGCDDLEERGVYEHKERTGLLNSEFRNGKKMKPVVRKNNHPTVKPTKLMSYLITLGSRENNLILDPFMGSGTTCISAHMLGRKWIGIEREKEYVEIANARMKELLKQTSLVKYTK